MAHFNFENEVNSVIRMDAPLGRGPLTQRAWQEPIPPQPHVNSSFNAPQNVSTSSTKTPSKGLNKSVNNLVNVKGQACKTPGSAGRKKTPSKGTKTPSAADRFIPNRSTTQFEAAHYKICTQTQPTEEAWSMMSPSQQEYKQIMSDNLNGDAMQKKIISFNEKPPMAPEGYQNDLRVLYSTGKIAGNIKKTTRYIPQVPERILDAPDIVDDYYLSLIDWSVQNVLAVALGGSVYLWNASSGDIALLMDMKSTAGDYVSCTNWTADGNHVALGLSTGAIELWDATKQKKLRTMSGHAARVGALSWNSYVLSSGSRTGAIHHHDVRIADHHVGTLQGHTQEVCGLRWSPNCKYLASGGNDNLLNIWRCDGASMIPVTEPFHTLNQHQAAVKALAWCPWQPSVLASGGGTADRHIRFWNCNNGASLSSVDTRSQVCALLWSEEYKEIISGHGFMQNQLILWKYPTMAKVSELTGHTARVLHMCMSPDGTTVVSAGADETLRLWKCFAVDDKVKKTKIKSSSTDDRSCLRLHMR